MKKSIFISFFCVGLAVPVLFANETTKRYDASGEVMTVDPLYARVTIQHKAIKDFSGEGETDFSMATGDSLKDIHTHDLVDFTIVDERGDVRIEKIVKTGEAPEKSDVLPLGQAVQDVLVATGEAAKVVTSPLPPAHELVGGTVDATTGATETVLADAGPEVKRKF